MDKLQPLIKHHYWICFGLSVILVVSGWWVASGRLAAEIVTRKGVVDAAFSSAAQGGDAPNSTWVEGALKENEADRKAYDDSSRALWQRQKDARIWHSALTAEMSKIPYNGMITRQSTRSKWGALYGDQFDALLKIISPFDMKEGTGLVLVDNRRISHKPYTSWRVKAPTSEEVWKNQEDIWLLRSLLTSLARVNEGASRITDAALREILALRLRGGDRAFVPSMGGGGGGMMGFGAEMGAGEMSFGGGMETGMPSDMGDAGMSAGAMPGMGGDMYSGMPGGAGAGAGGEVAGPWKQFEGGFGMDLLSEEFGPAGGGGGGGMGMGMDMGGMDPMGMSTDMGGGDPAAMYGDAGGMPGGDMSMGGTGFGGFGMGGAAAGEADRYVDDAEELPYKTRAFFLHVRVREDQIARLLAELTNSDFPVEIVRVDLKTFGSKAPAGGGMDAMYSGAGMGMDPAMAGMDPTMAMPGAGMDGGLSGEMGAGYGDIMGGGVGYTDPSMGYTDGGIGAMPGDMAMGGMDPTMMTGGLAEGGAYGAGGYGYPGAPMEGQTGRQVLSAALTDPALVELRVAGLMTLYQSKEETVAETATEAAAAQEAGVQSTVTPPADAAGTPSPAPDALNPADGAATPAVPGLDPASDTESAVPGLEGDSGAAGSDPADPNSLPTDPAAAVPGDPVEPVSEATP